MAFAAAFGEFAWDIAVDLLEAVEPFLVPGFPASGEEGEVEVVFVFEAFSVLGGAVAAFGEVGDESGFEAVVGELFEEDGSEADGQGRPATVECDLADHIEDGEVGFSGGLVEPGFAMGVGTMVKDVGEVAMENDAESTKRCSHRDAHGNVEA